MSGHDPGAERREHLTARINGLEDALVARGVVRSADVDDVVELYQRRLGPQHGAALVARAWTDDGFRARLLEDATAVLREEGYDGRGSRHDALQALQLVVVENTPEEHHLIVCTLCSCYPLALLGPPPRWYKSAEYRARAIRRPRDVLAEFGVTLEPGVSVSVWDSSADCRYLVLPQRPAGTGAYDTEELAALVTTGSLIGTQRTLGAPAGLTR
jgi:nitrile hydratase subunit alpha